MPIGTDFEVRTDGTIHGKTGELDHMGPVTATERYKMLLATALERVCVLEAELEEMQARLAELEATSENGTEVNDGARASVQS